MGYHPIAPFENSIPKSASATSSWLAHVHKGKVEGAYNRAAYMPRHAAPARVGAVGMAAFDRLIGGIRLYGDFQR